MLVTAALLVSVDVDAARPKGKSKSKNKPAATTQQTSSGVRSQKRENERRMRETDAQIKANNRLVTNQLNRLNLLRGQINACNDSIGSLSHTIDSITLECEAINDSIAILGNRLETLRAAFATALRNARHARATTSKLALIFASDSFTQAFRRLRAVDQFGRWRGRRADEISDVMEQLDMQRRQLDSLGILMREAQSAIANRRATLKTRRDSADKVVADLRGKDKELRRVLKEQQAKARQLDRELDRIIAEEQRKAAEEERLRKAEQERLQREALEAERRRAEQEKQRAQSQNDGKKSDKSSDGKNGGTKGENNGTITSDVKVDSPKSSADERTPDRSAKIGSTFASSKGALPSPVDGRYTVVKPFGRQHHPVYTNLEIDNSGIDLETSRGATVRCVYDGKVTAVFCPDNVTHVVVVRHGDYVTVYANLGTLSVHTGETVKRGQVLGTVYVDAADNNRSVLHFEIRNGANPSNIKRENPSVWLGRS